MEVDRYTQFVLTVIALALSTLAFKDIVAPQPAVAAAPTIQVPSSMSVHISGSISHSGYIKDSILGDDVPAPSPDSQ